MRAINLYTLTRNVENELMPYYEQVLSFRDDKIKIRNEELSLIKSLVSKIQDINKNVELLDNWFYSFEIPQISKEFDLIKLESSGMAVNVELKSQRVADDRIIKQLEQNKYYLNIISKKIHSFVYIKGEGDSYELLYYDGELKPVEIPFLIDKIKEISKPIIDNIEEYFHPREYLISPINTPDKFLNYQYFLTERQTEIKKDLLEKLNNGTKLLGIKGGAGTGKTLLLYDIIKYISRQYKTCMVHCGIVPDNLEYLNKKMENFDIIPAKDVKKETICKYEVIGIDEAHRIHLDNFDVLINAINNGEIRSCIFSHDYNQVMSKPEKINNIPEKLKNIVGYFEFELKTSIRTNKNIYSFIRSMLKNKDTPKESINYNCVDIAYAENYPESYIIKKLYLSKGYKFITLTPSLYKKNPIDHYKYELNSHKVIGQEFDKVIVILDENFGYSEAGELEGKSHPNPDYLFLKLFYQNITRAREKLCIVVVGNVDVFERLLKIKMNGNKNK